MQLTHVSIVFSVMEGLAVMLTLCRLGFRLKIQRFWWEDVWAAIASLLTVISIATTPVFFKTYGYQPVLISGWMNIYMSISALWAVRMSLLCSLLRITSSIYLRHITLLVSVFFLLFCATTVGLEAWWCADNTAELSIKPRPNCPLPHSIIIFEATSHCLSDLITLLLSLKLLWRVRLPRRQRRMILLLFIASRFLCIFSLAHSIAQLLASQGIQAILANLQVVVFMVVCNMVVVVTYMYRVFRRSPGGELDDDDDDDDDDDFTTPPRDSTQDMTTVDLDVMCASFTGTASDVENSHSIFSSAASSTGTAANPHHYTTGPSSI